VESVLTLQTTTRWADSQVQIFESGSLLWCIERGEREDYWGMDEGEGQSRSPGHRDQVDRVVGHRHLNWTLLTVIL
jgi:hypothetical protein